MSVEAGEGEPQGSKDMRLVDVLEITEAPENSHIGIRPSPPKKGSKINSSSEVHLHQCMQHRQQTGTVGSHCAAGKI